MIGSLKSALYLFLLAMLATRAAAMDSGTGCIAIATKPDSKSGFLAVEYIVDQGPAATAGIRTGDIVTAIDDHATRGLTASDMQVLQAGAIGSLVTLTVQRGGSPAEKIVVTRRSIPDAYTPAAIAGDARAQTYLGYFYETSAPPARDFEQAIKWYRLAANQGRAGAQVNLATMMRGGVGMPADETAATALDARAAASGDARGERELGICYYHGRGIEHDDRKSL